ncbi:MAG: YdcF family protein [Bacteroidia bacterium]|nr:YdcF family protein [Bacteroidota bacterium]MBP9081816.1 YdcF family protein [Bacteroidia bacterium]
MKIKFRETLRYFARIIGKAMRNLLLGLGCIALIMSIFAFTRVPYDLHRWLGENGSGFTFEPSNIIVLGGSGMPSESNLIRLYYAASAAKIHPNAAIIIAHPEDSSVFESMRHHLMSLGIDSVRIHFCMKGTNTREQSLQLKQSFPSLIKEKNVIVTNPENMYRTLKTFKKSGFEHVGGISAFEYDMYINLSYNHKKVGGAVIAPDVSENLDLRYNFWNYLKYEITCIREYVAIGYYKLNGWI